MRLLLIQGDACAVFEGRIRLAVFEGASELDKDTAEQVRTARIEPIKKESNDD